MILGGLEMWKTIEGAGRFGQSMPRPAAIVTCRLGEKANALAVAWHSPISFDPPLFGISIASKRFSLRLILESGEFAVNFLPFGEAEIIASVGGSTGAEIDKFERFQIPTKEALRIKAPLLASAYAVYECRVVDHRTWGDHEWIVGEVLVTHYDPEAFTPRETLDLRKVEPALYLGGEIYVSAPPAPQKVLDRREYGRKFKR